MILHGYWRSSSSWRVRIGFALKELEYDYRAVHLVEEGGRQHAPEYRAKNPMRQVPMLEWEENGQWITLTQSLAILEFLEELRPQPPLLPANRVHRARARELAEIINAGTQPLQNLAVIQKLKNELGVDARVWSREWIARGLQGYEALAERYAGTYSVGDEVTLADLCLVPQLYNARRFDVDLSVFPTILGIEERCLKLDAFVVSHPDHQPDAR
ncbi:maleylacetoacetate isomerase [Lujinxingia litoralis]|uniref:Maleylacetoacetate isomerase n=1 Tax=Lujinxingia litoralis TaxID=2211119 RepID=A0A328CA43_9DELT|nr:maleylacetoacetate isomerase [Lujinxingia litoralis]RAL25507.1 maleylacetoacetate isomerase [Lujinxingia litoralis]